MMYVVQVAYGKAPVETPDSCDATIIDTYDG